ncbi:tetratricopeptide repeat protein [Aquimarina gracilis]|uniref:Tetratricopeptide repeat protein n=1 Tax=Aquimarina gracilis TaxID=874422 RepID=A0ABU5ZY10_9FLAO|nr:tetratricopeptide repeat protein [Aquimarina gracilis]MEB3346746.1 tetratricopeptide repeat protein [Aquimarina gracilis]
MKVKNFLMNYEEILQSVSSQKIILGIIVITLIVFGSVFTGSEFLSYDDNWYIYENENVINLSWQSIKNIFSTLQGGQYSPLGEVYHSIIYYFFGENATAFKICALLVHLVNVFLLFKIFDKLFKDKLLVIIVVLLFAIHPMQVETIGWISVIFRNAVLLMFLGYLFYLKYLESNFKKIRLIPVLICYVLALLTKEQAILFPVGLLLINLIKFDSIWNKRVIVEMISCVVITLIFGLVTIEITKTGGPNIIDRNVSFYEKIALLSKTFLLYFYNFLFPIELSYSYPYPYKESNVSVFTVLTTLILLLLGSFISIKDRIFRFGFLWTLGFLSLALAFAFFHLRDSHMADRYAYVAIIGFSVLLYRSLFYLKEKLKMINKGWFVISLGLFIVFFSISSFNRVHVFKNNKNLWTQALEVNPKNPFAYNSLGYYYRNQGKLDTAKILYKKSIKLSPNYFLAHNNITKLYYEQKQYDSAFYHVSRAIALHPAYEHAYENRAYLYFVTNQREKYLKDLNKLLEFSPENERYLISRAKFYFKEKKYTEALEDGLNTIKVNQTKESHIFYIVGHSYLTLKNYKEAEKYLSMAIGVDNKKSKYYFSRSVARVSTNNWKLSLKDALQAKKLGYKINQAYLTMLIREVKKRNN